jgi:hypothetical protein
MSTPKYPATKLFLCTWCGSVIDFAQFGADCPDRPDPTCPRCDRAHSCRELSWKEIESALHAVRIMMEGQA